MGEIVGVRLSDSKCTGDDGRIVTVGAIVKVGARVKVGDRNL